MWLAYLQTALLSEPAHCQLKKATGWLAKAPDSRLALLIVKEEGIQRRKEMRITENRMGGICKKKMDRSQLE